jgi:hypothetical protein
VPPICPAPISAIFGLAMISLFGEMVRADG